MNERVRIEDVPDWFCRDHCNAWSHNKQHCNVRSETHCDHPSAEWAAGGRDLARKDKGEVGQ